MIRHLTAETATIPQLLDLYATGKLEPVKFALDQLAARGEYSPVVLSQITDQLTSHGEAIRPALEFLEKATMETGKDVYHRAIEDTFAKCGKNGRIQILESLSRSVLKPPGQFYDNLGHFLPLLESYYEAHLLLELENTFNSQSSGIVHDVLKFLENENFLIARRAFWFLQEMNLSPDQAAAIAAFETKFADRL